jgi:hypothetical protein
MNARAKKILLLALAVALLFGSGQIQKSLNLDRARLGLTYAEVLEDAPPVLAFTTVALGGFRGLISNYLWIRANDLQQDDKYFEAAQLADWITDLEPHFSQVWLFQAWNMTYNISIKFKDFPDRWRWVERGIELLRDRGLRYNPDDIMIYHELAWFFQHKIGQNLDDANLYYKQEWAREMTPFFGPDGTNFTELLHPQTAEERTNVLTLREKYKINPEFAKKVDEEYGPLDWRLPEAHAIYWDALGLQVAKKDPDKVNRVDVLMLRRGIYQSMLQAFHHGRIITDPFNRTYALAPNLDIIPRVNDAYEDMMKQDPKDKDNIAIGHRNFLADAVYYLYEDNRIAEAAKWYRILGEKYPDKTLLVGDANSYPRNLTLDQYAIGRVQGDINDTSQDAVMGIVQGLLTSSYYSLAIGQDDRYAGLKLLARKAYDNFQKKASRFSGEKERVGLPPWDTINRAVLDQLLDLQQGLPYAARAVIRTQLGMPTETNSAVPFPIPTNAVVSSASSNTNASATNSVAK